jgi:glycosyltransferase involved in cell wall biosynthesis
MKKRILVVNWRDIKNPEAGGAEVHYHEIFRRLDREKYEVSVLAHRFPGCLAEESAENIRIYRRGSRTRFNFWVYFNINRFIKKHGFDLIVDDVNKIPFFLPKIVKKPVVAVFHHLFGTSIYKEFSHVPASYVFLGESLIGPVYRDTPFMAVSQSTLRELVNLGFDASNGAVIHNGVNLVKFRPKPDIREPFHILSLSRMKKYKNLDFLLVAAEELKKIFPRVRLTIAGSGSHLGTLREKAGDRLYVHFPGRVSEMEKVRLYQKASIFVNPSVKEGWSITNIEANACGTPVLASDVDGLGTRFGTGKPAFSSSTTA